MIDTENLDYCRRQRARMFKAGEFMAQAFQDLHDRYVDDTDDSDHVKYCLRLWRESCQELPAEHNDGDVTP
jgi:hypothetical protein